MGGGHAAAGARVGSRAVDLRELVAVFVGGFAGAVARAGLLEAAPPEAGAWPWPTFVANVAGAFALGLVVARLPASGLGRPLLGAGLCGGLTTFATMQLELLAMLDASRAGLALLYAGGSLGAGLVAVRVATRAERARPA
jgi:fluoride exporter